MGRGSWRGGSKLVGLGEHCKLPQRGSGQSLDHFGCTKSPEDGSTVAENAV